MCCALALPRDLGVSRGRVSVCRVFGEHAEPFVFDVRRSVPVAVVHRGAARAGPRALREREAFVLHPARRAELRGGEPGIDLDVHVSVARALVAELLVDLAERGIEDGPIEAALLRNVRARCLFGARRAVGHARHVEGFRAHDMALSCDGIAHAVAVLTAAVGDVRVGARDLHLRALLAVRPCHLAGDALLVLLQRRRVFREASGVVEHLVAGSSPRGG